MEEDLKYYHSLKPLMEKKSAMTNLKTFHNKVNVVFHDVEAKYYDIIHKDILQSSSSQVELVVEEILGNSDNPLKRFRVLDVGCGTGLMTDILLNTKLGVRIDSVDLLDTSKKMLRKAEERSRSWDMKVSLICGDIDFVKEKYDLVIASFLLHHIPNLKDFFRKISLIQDVGAFFFTIHDPSAESFQGTIYKERSTKYHELMEADYWQQYLTDVGPKEQIPNYIEEVNKKLLKEETISIPLTEDEIWSITDIHVEDLPYSNNTGISIQMMKQQLIWYQSIVQHVQLLE